jgi:nucleotide-binding universal stress UspA family protein
MPKAAEAQRQPTSGSPSPSTPAPLPLARVLVATDLSTQAGLALRRAALLPLAEGARLELLYVLPEPRPKTRVVVPRPLRRKMMAEIDAVDILLRRRGVHGTKLEAMIAHGDPYERILAHARSSHAELVVLGRHGTSGVRTMLLGSTAERVVRGRVAPVLVVSTPADSPYERPLLGLDPQDDIGASVLPSALRLLGPAAPGLTLVSAYEVALEGWLRAGDVPARDIAQLRKQSAQEAHEALKRAAARLRGRLNVRAEVRAGDARAVLLRAIDRRRPDLVVLGTHARRGLARFLLGSVAVEVLRSSKTDVAIVPPRSSR